MKFGNIELEGRIYSLKLELVNDIDTIDLDTIGRMFYNQGTNAIEVVTDDGIKSLQFGYDSNNKLVQSLGDNWINPDYSFNPTPFNEFENVGQLSSSDSLYEVLRQLDANISSFTVNSIVIDQNRFILLTDNRNRLRINASSNRQISIRNHTTTAYPDNFEVEIEQSGNGLISFTAEAGVTLNYNANYTPVTNGRFSVCNLKRNFENNWTLSGNLAPA